MNKQILLIEDESLILDSLKRMLEMKGASVDATLSGKDALHLLSLKKYDKIVCDLMLRDVTGFDIIEESKKYYSSEEISTNFIIITAYSSENVLSKARKYGCRIFAKPFDDVHATIIEILE